MLKDKVDTSHEFFDEGWYVSDPVCKHCRIAAYSEAARWPCETQLKLPFDKD